MQEYNQIIQKISEANNILIISHIGPDGDTIGSTLALAEIINTNFENVKLQITEGRHDPCCVPRAVPVVEAMTAMVLMDMYLINKAYDRK